METLLDFEAGLEGGSVSTLLNGLAGGAATPPVLATTLGWS